MKKGHPCAQSIIIANIVEMPSLISLTPFAALFLLCCCRPTASDAPPPAPQPSDPPAPNSCQFDLGFGLYDLNPLNVRR